MLMYELEMTRQFKKDYKLAQKRGFPTDLLWDVIDKLVAQEALEEKHHDHALSGNYIGFRECHIKPDFLLIYAIDNGRLVLTASRTGTHSDLF